MKRIVAFDYIRAISVVCIILCHFFYNYDNTRVLAGWFGNTFNTIFITMSAFLIGLKWEKTNREPLGFSFLIDRIKKLSYTYYPYLIFMFLFMYFIEQKTPTIIETVLHFIFCPIIQRIPNWGHLWFISMIVICYSCTYVYTKIIQYFKINTFIICLFGITALTFTQLYNLSTILANVIIYTCLYVIIFANAKQLINYIKKQNSITKTAIAITLLIVLLLLVHDSSFNKSNLYGLTFGVSSAIILFILMFNFFNSKKANGFICLISEISFEIYLVHNIFTLSDYSIIQYIHNPILALLSILLICFITGYCLKRMSIKQFIK